jgi:hypothetical protein
MWAGNLDREGGCVVAEVGGVVVTGVYGVGKSSLVEEMATVLEDAGISYAAIDLDWLWWFSAVDLEVDGRRRVLLANLSTVVGNYLAVGVTRFVMAWSMRDRADVAALGAAVPFPLQVVRLTVPLEVVRARLAHSVTTGRSDDLRAAQRWLSEGIGADLGDVEVVNDRPIRAVADETMAWLGWLESE